MMQRYKAKFNCHLSNSRKLVSSHWVRKGKHTLIICIFFFALKVSATWAGNVLPASIASQVMTYEASAEILVTNIIGLSCIRQVSPFHAGGAITSNPEFLIETLSGHVLDPERLLVGSTFNYGMGRYDDQMLPGVIMSLDVGQGRYAIPDNFAVENTKTLNGKVMIYSAQNKNYVNQYYNSTAVTQHYPNVANPKYISINNAFGRPWQANAPYGINGAGLISVSDPDGRPLANPPSIDNGGVFFGDISNRKYGGYITNTFFRALLPGHFAREPQHQYITGNLNVATISTTFMGISPDSSNFAVFASVGADGSVTQIHVQDGVDGLIKEAVIQPHKDESTSAGSVFRWIPSFALYITDFYGGRVAVLSLTTDENVYRTKSVSYIHSSEIKEPVDIAAAIPEIANPRFSSNTTMAGTSDLYVANKNGTIIRIDEKGNVLAKVKVVTDYANSLKGEIRSISTSYDAQTIFIGMEGINNKDFIAKIPAFNSNGLYPNQNKDSDSMLNFANTANNVSTDVSVELGKQLFAKKFSPNDGIRHVFNANSCIACHDSPVAGGFSSNEDNFVRRVSKYNKQTGQFNPVHSHNYPVAKRKDVSGMGISAVQKSGIPVDANIISMRMPPLLLRVGRLDEIADSVLIAHARSKGDGIQGRVNYVDTAQGKKIGRYGWKASHVNLQHIVADALATEIGLDNPYTNVNQTQGVDPGNGYIVEAITRYLQQISVDNE